jgi:hypothetical protein
MAAGVVTFILPYTSVGQSSFAFVPLPPGVVVLVLGILMVYFLSAEAAKRPFFRRYKL